MGTIFCKLADDVSTVLPAGRAPGATSVAVRAGDGPMFGNPSPSSPVPVTLVAASAVANGLITDRTKTATYRATGRTGDTLTGLTFESGVDQRFEINDLAYVLVNAARFTDIHGAVNALEAEVAAGGGGAGVPTPYVNANAPGTGVVGDGVTDDGPALLALLNANPGRDVRLRRTVGGSGFNPSGGPVHSYYSSVTLELNSESQTISGEGGTGGVGTLIKFAPGVAGIRMNRAGTQVRNLGLLGSENWSGVYYWEGIIPAGRFPGLTVGSGASAADGIQVTSPYCRISNVSVIGFGRDGINASAGDLGLGLGFGAEDCELDLVFLANNRGNGLTVAGGDSNCTLTSVGVVFVNQFWGMDASAFLAAVFTAPQATQNGFDNSQNLSGADTIATVSGLTRTGNLVTLTWSAPYTAPVLLPGQGVRVMACPSDPSFVGRWRVLSVASDNRSLTYTQVAPDAAASGGGIVGRANNLPPDLTFTSANRAGGAVTLTFAVAPVSGPPSEGFRFRVGQGVTLLNCTPAAFNGTFVVLSVSTDGKTLTYSQAGADGAATAGTARMAIPADTWAAAGLMGGAYNAPVITNNAVWINPYAEGGQRSRFSSANLILNPTWGQGPDPDAGNPLIIWASSPGLQTGGASQQLSVVSAYDLETSSYVHAGTTAPQIVNRCYRDHITVPGSPRTIWKERFGPGEWSVYHKDPLVDVTATARLYLLTDGTAMFNSEGSIPVTVNNHYGGPGLVVGAGASRTDTTWITGGCIHLDAIPDSLAQNGSVFRGSDHAGALCWKNGSGTVTVILP